MSFFSRLRGFFDRPQPAPNPAPVEVAPTIIIRQPDPVARYESAFQYYGERSLIPATLQDARFDYTPGIRKELQRRSRYWERNDAIYQRLIMLFEQYVVGPNGLRILPNSKDKDWNLIAQEKWSDWCKDPELDGGGEGNESFADTQTLIARNWFVDGEVFVYLTYDVATQEPKLQLIEAHRVDTPTSMAAQEGVNIIDGIEINPRTRKRLYYWVRKLDTAAMLGIGNTLYPYVATLQQEYERVPAAQIIHVFKRFRPGAIRGIPAVFCVGNDLHDLSDLQQEEMKAAKSAADIANVWHTKTGEPTDASSFRRVPRTISTQDAQGNPVSKQSAIYYDVTQGGRDKFLKPGEDVKQFVTERPSVATREFWDYLTFRLCAGMGISRLLVAPYAPAQGTVVRSDLDCNNTFFKTRSRKIMAVSLKIYQWKMGYSVDWDRDLIGAPDDWKKAKVRPPRSITADVGHQSEATINEYNAGLRTLPDIYAEQGEDWEEKLEERAKVIARAKELAEQYDVPVEQLLPPPKQLSPAPVPIKLPRPAPTNGNGNGHPLAEMYPSLTHAART
jgi:lambda family phage portal protein